MFTQSIHFVTFCAEKYGVIGTIQSRPELACQRPNRSRRAPMNRSGPVLQPLYVLSVGGARASRAVFGAIAEHTVRSAGRRPVQPRRLRSPTLNTDQLFQGADWADVPARGEAERLERRPNRRVGSKPALRIGPSIASTTFRLRIGSMNLDQVRLRRQRAAECRRRVGRALLRVLCRQDAGYLFSVGSARASRAVFGALAEHTVRSAGRRPVQPRRLRSPS